MVDEIPSVVFIVVVVCLFFPVKTIVTGTTIAEITTRTTKTPRIIHIFFFRIIELLKKWINLLLVIEITYSVDVGDESDTTYASRGIDQDYDSVSRKEYFFIFVIYIVILVFIFIEYYKSDKKINL